jgi:hypothetical protein
MPTPNPTTATTANNQPEDGLQTLAPNRGEFENYANLIRIARQYPRQEATILRESLDELALVPSEAVRSFYSIPYRDNQTGNTVKVEGLSYNAAVSLIRRWGNCTVGAHLLSEDEDGWDLAGYFLDFQSNVRLVRPFRSSKWEKRRNGPAVKLDAQRELMAFQRDVSKAIRNASLAGLPPYLKAQYWSKARQLAGSGADQSAQGRATIVGNVRAAFERWSVTPAMLEQYVGVPIAEWSAEHIGDLRGLWNAINDGQTTVEQAFHGAAPPVEDARTPTTVTPDSLTTARVSGTDNSDPATPLGSDGTPTAPGGFRDHPAENAAAPIPVEPPRRGRGRPRNPAPPPDPAPTLVTVPVAAPAAPGGLSELESQTIRDTILAQTSHEAVDRLHQEFFAPGGVASRATSPQRMAIMRTLSERHATL